MFLHRAARLHSPWHPELSGLHAIAPLAGMSRPNTPPRRPPPKTVTLAPAHKHDLGPNLARARCHVLDGNNANANNLPPTLRYAYSHRRVRLALASPSLTSPTLPVDWLPARDANSHDMP